MKDPIVGIDLGTSNSVVAHADGAGIVKVLADDGGYKIHPSVVSFHPNGGVVVGTGAKQRKVIDPQNTIYSVKRLIGRGWSSPEVQIARTRVPYQIKEGANQLPMIATRGGEFAIPEISAIVLDHMRNIAAARLETAVARAVVTVPASFNDAQRSATATAGAIAGLTIVRVLNEPTAAALAYGNTRNLRETIAVYDFGGGTFDITILKLHDQVYEVLGTSGDTFLGGDDLDERLVDKMVAKFLAENRLDLRTNEVAMMRLRAVAEQTKIELSRRSRAVVRIDEIAYGAKGVPLNLSIEITRDEFVTQVSDIIDRTFPVCQEALTVAGLQIGDISDVILVGGTTKIPYVRDQVTKFFAKPPRSDVNPEDAVAVGAALQATSLERILARPRPASRSVPVPVPVPAAVPGDFATGPDSLDSIDAYTDVVEFDTDTQIPAAAERTKRQTSSGYSELGRRPEPPKPDTSYSVTRSGSKELFEPLEPDDKAGPLDDKTSPAHAIPKSTDAFDSRTPPANAQPLGRLTTRSTQSPATKRTLFGVPAGEAASPPPIPKSPTARHSVPPRPPGSAEPTSPRPTPVPLVTNPGLGPLPTRPGSPSVAPIAPGAPTIVASAVAVPAADPVVPPTARGFAAQAPTMVLEAPPNHPVSPASAPSPVILEVTPRSLGIATVAGFCEELIRRNSRVPTEIRRVFTTSRDQQNLVRIVVCQGESRRLDKNTVIGDLILQNLLPRPRGETSIEVTFVLDASGILQVHARDAQTGTEQRAALDLVGSVPQEDVAVARDRIQQLRR